MAPSDGTVKSPQSTEYEREKHAGVYEQERKAKCLDTVIENESAESLKLLNKQVTIQYSP